MIKPKEIKALCKPEGRGEILNLLLTILFIVFSFVILAIRNASMLRWYDEMSLFESTGLFFNRFIHYPGGILRYAGTWLTQLMYYPALGSSVLILLWLLMILLSRMAFGLRRALYPLAFLLPLCMFVSVVQLDEAWLSLKSPGYLFFPTLGYICTILLYWLYRTVYRKIFFSATVALLIPFLYPLLGFYALLAALLCVIDMLTKANITLRISALFVSILIYVVPVICYTYIGGITVDNDYLWLKGLPELMMVKFDLYLWWPFIIATCLTVILSLLHSFSSDRLSGSVYMQWAEVALAVAGGIWGMKADNKSEQLRASVLMLRCLERNDWGGVMHIMSLTREAPNYSMLAISNLAKVSLGGEADHLGDFRPSNLNARHSEKFTITAFVQVPINYYIGRFNQSYRWAMEHTVQYGKRVFFLKYMVKDALMRGEITLAKRYNDILLSTMFHKKWAEEMNRYIENPELIGTNPEFEAVKRMGEMEKLRGE